MRRILATTLLLAAGSVASGACHASSSPGPQPTPDDVLRTCAIISACDGAAQVAPISDECALLAYVAAYPAPADSLAYGCFFSATDCASYQACFGPSAAQKAACAGATKAQCQGDVWVDCGGSGPSADCSSVGLVCGESAMGAACGTMTCDPATFQPTCQSATGVTCDPAGGVVEENPCDPGQACVISNGAAECQDGTGTCPASFAPSCDGTVATNCKGGVMSTVDCAALGLGIECQVTGGSAQCVGTSGCKPDVPGYAETCDAGTITLCIAGATVSLDCKQYGLSGCTTTTLPNGEVAARCVP
jgi:hypothetical protein